MLERVVVCVVVMAVMSVVRAGTDDMGAVVEDVIVDVISGVVVIVNVVRL